MTKEEMKDRISMALKDPILQQGFEVICKENEELEEVRSKQAELINRDTIRMENQKYQIKKLETENTNLRARLNAVNLLTPELEQASKLRQQQLTEAKEIILTLLNNFAYPIGREDWAVEDEEIVDKAEQFLKEIFGNLHGIKQVLKNE